MDDPSAEDRAARIRRARQVLAGPEIEPPDEPLDFGHRSLLGYSRELYYLLTLGALVVLAAILWAAWGMGPASAVLFLLALALLAGWFVL